MGAQRWDWRFVRRLHTIHSDSFTAECAKIDLLSRGGIIGGYYYFLVFCIPYFVFHRHVSTPHRSADARARATASAR